MKTYDIHKYRKIALISLYSFIPFLILTTFHIGFIILVCLLFSGFFVLSSLFWRCPACERALPIRHGSIDESSYCLYCGASLNEPLVIKNLREKSQSILIKALIGNLIIASLVILFIYSEANKAKQEEALFESITNQIETIMMQKPEIIERLGIDFSNENVFLTDRLVYSQYLGYHMIIQGTKGSASLLIVVDQEDTIQKIEVQLFDAKEQKDTPDFILSPL